MDGFTIRPVAVIRNAMKDKFGIPRQSMLAPEVVSEIVFEPEYRVDDALRGIEGFSHLWLLWRFSEAADKPFSPTVRPPRLGGNERVGVFATRSPYRPNSIGLSCVKLIGVEKREGEGSVLIVAGADLMDGTPIIDVKPYLPYADAIKNAAAGFAPDGGYRLEVVDESGALDVFPSGEREAVISLLANDPRPRYHDDESRVYGMKYGDHDVKFRVSDGKAVVESVGSADKR